MSEKPITMADLAVLLAKTTTEKKARKKATRTPEQEIAMKEKLKLMREKSMANRKAKSEERISVLKTVLTPSLEIKKISESDSNELFEKKYNSKFEKLDETITHIKSSLDEMKELKKKKAIEKAEKEKVKEEVKNISTPTPTPTPTPANTKINNPYAIPKVINYNNLFKR
tara:strand:+ start:3346 stop:3855 length:510 start_codon:yes stop_codon:yes gene_type:complete